MARVKSEEVVHRNKWLGFGGVSGEGKVRGHTWCKADEHLEDHSTSLKAKPSARTSIHASAAEAVTPLEAASACASWHPRAALAFRNAASSEGHFPVRTTHSCCVTMPTVKYITCE